MTYPKLLPIVGGIIGAAASAQTYQPGSGTPPSVLLQAPRDGVSYFETGQLVRSLLRQEEYLEAEPLAERLVSDYSRDGFNWVLLARVKRGLGKHAESAAAYEQAGPLIGWFGWAPAFDPSINAAIEHVAAGNHEPALRILARAVFEQRIPVRSELYNIPGLEPLRENHEFLRIVGRVDVSKLTRHEGMRRDIDYLIEELRLTNPEYHDEPLPAELLRRAEHLKRDVPRLSDEEVFVGMQEMLAVLRQGHLTLWGDETARTPNRFLPLRIYAFPAGLFIIDSSPEYRHLIGSQLLKIGDLDAPEAWRRLAAASSVDGDMQHVWGVSRLAETYYLKGIGAIDDTDVIRLVVRENGKDRVVRAPTAAEQIADRLDKLVAPSAVEPPLFLSNLEEAHWERLLPEHDALYVQVNNLRDDRDESLIEFGRRLAQVISASSPKNLILDLRHNNGGITGLYPELLRTLIAFTRRPENQLYVLTGRRTYSAAGNFITDLERLADPIFVGEASSECCNLFGDPRYIKLPFSGIKGELTAIKWNLSMTPFDRRREISPEVPVQLTAEDYFKGRDPVVAAVSQLIRKRNQQ